MRGLLWGLLGVLVMADADANGQQIDVWLGTGASSLSRGIYHCTFDTQKGKLADAQLVAEIHKPGFLAFHPQGTHLYAAGSLNNSPCVAAYKIAKRGRNTRLELVNSVPIGDGGAAHISVERGGNTLLTAQYSNSSVAVFSLNKDGSVAQRTQLIKHADASGVNARRQEKPHPHWTGFSPDFKFAFVPDLGMDKVVIYRLDAENSQLTEHGFGAVPPGAGPRHMKFHTNGKWIYVLNELKLSVTVFDWDADAGRMTAKQTIPTVPQAELDREIFKSCSEIRVHPNGKFVYAANRGHDTITVFAVDADTGTLSEVEREHVRGATPRNFNIDPEGNWLLAGGQTSHTLSAFKVNSTTGELTFNQSVIHVPAPICVLFGP